MICIVCLVLLQVLLRYVFGMPLLWPEEITKWCLVWTGYIAAGVALRPNQHVSLTLFINKLSEPIRFWILFAGKAIILFFLVFFVRYGIQQAISNPSYSWAVQIRLIWVMLGMPLAGILMLVHIFYLIAEDLLALYSKKSDRVQEEKSW
jgi:TRAP-type C4-dicarboxylate transport system permease small subunit